MPNSDPAAQAADRAYDAAATGRDDERSDLQQAVEARSDAVARGEGGPEPDTFTSPGDFTGNSGEGGVVKNQDDMAQ